MEEVEGGGQAGDIAENVVEALDGRAFETMLGNGIVDVLDGVVGDLELVPVGVDQLTVGLSGLVIHLGHGGERG